MLLLRKTRPLTFFGKYSAHLDYRGWKGRGGAKKEGGAKREGPGGRGKEGGDKREGPGERSQEDSRPVLTL